MAHRIVARVGSRVRAPRRYTTGRDELTKSAPTEPCEAILRFGTLWNRHIYEGPDGVKYVRQPARRGIKSIWRRVQRTLNRRSDPTLAKKREQKRKKKVNNKHKAQLFESSGCLERPMPMPCGLGPGLNLCEGACILIFGVNN